MTELRAERTFYLCTDGFLDQAGGDKGFGFGNARFIDMLRLHATLPLAGQCSAFASTLAAYQGAGESLSETINRADKALYAAKGAGRNRYEIAGN